MPRATPSTKTRSSISLPGNLRHLAAATCRIIALYGAEQELLARLAASVKGPRDLGSAERAVRQRAAVFAGEGDAEGRAVVDDQVADLGQAIDVRLAAAEVAPLDRVVKQPPDAVAVVGIILGGVDAPLGGDAVRPAGRILQAEGQDVVAQFGQRRGGRRAGQPACRRR